MAKRILQLSIVPSFLAVCLLTGTLRVAADPADNPFAGKWKLNPSRSTLTDQMKVQEVGPNKYNFIFSGDNVETIVADGSDQTALFDSTLAVTVEAPDSWKVVRKSKGRITIIGLWKLSPDGTTLTDNFTGYRADGTTSNLHYIYKRTAGTSGFPGTWESTTEDVNSVFELQIQPYQTDGLSFIYPGSSLIKSLKMDDKEYPNSGPNAPAGYTSSMHRVSAQTLQMTDRMNGKLYDTQQIEVAADGKTLTMTTTIPGQSKPNIMVFDRE
jgi:hypothetical protein